MVTGSEIELVTYWSNHQKEEELQTAVLTTQFCAGRPVEILTPDDSDTSREFVEFGNSVDFDESLETDEVEDYIDLGFDVCTLDEGFDVARNTKQNVEADRMSLDSNTVAVDWDTEKGSFLTFHKVSNRSMQQQGYLKGYTMTLNNRVKSEPTFTSYIDLDKEEGAEEAMQITPDLLEGELCVSKADRVCSYSTVSGLTSGMTGTLFVTTLKLSLKLHIEDEQKIRKNKILAPWDIPLSSIFAIYEITGEGVEKKKRLSLGSNVSSKVEGIFIICKNFRFYKFSFKFAKIDEGRNVVNALLHHVRPKKNNLLFAFEQHIYTSLGSTPSVKSGWDEVRRKSEAQNVRLSRANENWQISHSLPQEFIVPGHITDEKLGKMSGLFVGSRPPVWVWGTPRGGGLYLQPNLNVQPSLQIDQLRDDFYGARLGKIVKEIDLDRLFPLQTALEESFSLMLDLHCIEAEKEAEKIDTEYFSRLENSGWLKTVSCTLRTSQEICDRLLRDETVVLIEGEGRGSSILVASLVELMYEGEYRTRQGFENLVQNNWVSLGFPFSVNHQLCSPKSENSVVPIFLVFLDAVYQLIQQFPSQFDFRPEYLIDLWDTALLPIFDTFIFDSEHDRSMARRNPETPLKPSPAWNWSSQFSPEYIKSWENPLYDIPRRPERTTWQDPHPSSMIMEKQILPGLPENKKYLPVNPSIPALSTWLDLFHRSVAFFQKSKELDEKLLRMQRSAKAEIEKAGTNKRPVKICEARKKFFNQNP